LLLLASCVGKTTPDRPLTPAASEGVRMTLPRLGGGKLTIDALRGQPVLITLFTTWCLRCQAEAPRFVRFGERPGLKVVGIALDDLTKLSLITTYVTFVGFRFPVLLAQPDDLELVGGLGVTKQVPRTVLLDPVGRVIQDHVGQTSFDKLAPAIDRLLAPSRPPSGTVMGD